MAETAFDLVLAGSLAAVAWSALRVRDLQGGIVLFIAFGLLMALAWARLEAPDLALAEAAIGAGVTGALLLEALARLEGRRGAASAETSVETLVETLVETSGETSGERQPVEFGDPVEAGEIAGGADHPEPAGAAERAIGLAGMVAAAAGAIAVAAAILALPDGQGGLRAAVESEIGASGAENPVTAVLLNFRAYDTWLEVAVLLAAAAAILAVLGVRSPGDDARGRPSELLGVFTRALVPLILLAGIYLLWRGTSGPGGAFQAGAVLAAGAILLAVTRIRPGPARLGWRRRSTLVLGLLAFALLGLVSLAAGEAFLTYPEGTAGTVILAIEAAVTLSIAVTLAGAFAAVATPRVGGKR